ncbi:DUF2165 family protein [Caballeronia sp. LjRoot31]|jgi:predicted small integral membrane protein
MGIVRVSKLLLASLVSFGNLTGYGTNLAFVQHVFLMDTSVDSRESSQ